MPLIPGSKADSGSMSLTGRRLAGLLFIIRGSRGHLSSCGRTVPAAASSPMISIMNRVSAMVAGRKDDRFLLEPRWKHGHLDHPSRRKWTASNSPRPRITGSASRLVTRRSAHVVLGLLGANLLHLRSRQTLGGADAHWLCLRSARMGNGLHACSWSPDGRWLAGNVLAQFHRTRTWDCPSTLWNRVNIGVLTNFGLAPMWLPDSRYMISQGQRHTPHGGYRVRKCPARSYLFRRIRSFRVPSPPTVKRCISLARSSKPTSGCSPSTRSSRSSGEHEGV